MSEEWIGVGKGVDNLVRKLGRGTRVVRHVGKRGMDTLEVH